jgi:hypothetical protein
MANTYHSRISRKNADIIGAVREEIRRGRHFGLGSIELMDAVDARKSKLGYWKLPRWAKNYVDGYCDCLREAMWQNDLEWKLSLDGEFRTTREIGLLADEAEKKGGPRSDVWNRVIGGHYWKENGKPYTTPEATVTRGFGAGVKIEKAVRLEKLDKGGK